MYLCRLFSQQGVVCAGMFTHAEIEISLQLKKPVFMYINEEITICFLKHPNYIDLDNRIMII